MWFLLVLAVLLFGCPPPAQYTEVRPGLSCDRATKVAYRTMVSLGYTVTDVVRASPARTGGITGTKTFPDGRTVTEASSEIEAIGADAVELKDVNTSAVRRLGLR